MDQVQEFIKQKNWVQALDLCNKLLGNQLNTAEQNISFLTERAQCYLELNNPQAVMVDAKSVIKISPDYWDSKVCLARKRLIHSLCLLKRFAEADMAARDWLILLQESDINKEVKAIVENFLGGFLNCTNSKQKTMNSLKILDSTFLNNSNSTSKMDKSSSLVSCIYCNVSFTDKIELRQHCQTDMHEMMIMSDEGHDWFRRPPPRGLKSDSYVLCENWKESDSCRYGVQCIQAHGAEELIEWRERFHYREMRIQKAKEKELFGKSYTEELLEKWIQSPNPSALMRDKIDDVEDRCSCQLSTTVCSKNSLHDWTFHLKTRRPLKAVALLQDTHRNHFLIAGIMIKNCKIDLKNDQEWISSSAPIVHQDSMLPVDYRIKVVFTTGIFGTFRQSVVFDFQSEPVLVKHLVVDVVPDSDLDKIIEIRKEITASVSISERWTAYNADIVPYRTASVEEWEKRLRSLYSCPIADTFVLSHATVTERKFTTNNYRERMHELLFVEEMARYELVARYNLTTKLQIAHSYILSPNSTAASTAKYSSDGELFASVALGRELSEDTSEGRLILMHCSMVYFAPCDASSRPARVYEALIEDKGKNRIYLRLSSQAVSELTLTPDSDLSVQIQFQLNRIPYCEWHYTLDKMANFKAIFPDTYLEPNIPWSPSRQWSRSLDPRLNIKQKEAVVAITTPLNVLLPPILVIGPFGTGKTFTLAQAIKELIKDSFNKILLCTHSNSAADLYIKDYLDGWVDAGDENARPLRIYYTKRWVTTVHPIVQKYCLIKSANNARTFEMPALEDLQKHRIVVVTLSTSVCLSAMGLPQGFFTHILLDEAAQAIECETVTPLALAHESTRIVLAGDHMQLGPDIFSQFARQRNLHVSLLERLYDRYPANFPCKVLLCENYRAHEALIRFTSESFYDQKLVSSSKPGQPRHPKFHPLTFFTTRGEDVQDNNSTAFYNNSEVYEVVERVSELKRNWPAEWGAYDEHSIGVVTPYSDQVFRIRAELRKKRIDNVCVERVLNVQGKQFRAVVLSTVRTRKTCSSEAADGQQVDYGFLSNSKLLNTAVTRAQSLVAVVGDPIALCSLGRCSKVWERFIQICKDNDSLFGITWTQLKLQLDGIELKKIYTLNPLAPEFYPRKYKDPAGQSVKVESGPITEGPSPPPPLPQPQPQPPPAPLALPKQQQQTPTSNLVTTIVPPVISPFQDFRFFPPILYPQQPRPFLFNIVPPPVPQINNPVLSSGFPQPVRVANPSLVQQQQPPPPRVISTIAPQPQLLNKHLVQHATAGTSRTIVANGFLNQAPKAPWQSNNKLIQFMNNVHFPEANNVLNDCVNLLPQNMSLADMLLQPPNLQERWYNYLKDSTGPEAAEKFKYLLHTTNQKGSKVLDRNIFGRATPQPCESPTFCWYDSPTNQINFNKPVYMTENVAGCSDHHIQQQHFGKASLFAPDSQADVVCTPNRNNILCKAHSDLMRQVATAPQSSCGMKNGLISSNLTELELQKHINDEFANLNINSSDVNEVFQALTVKCETVQHVNGGGAGSRAQAGPRFYKYFQ